ncbi:diacylglycerol kinase family protein [Notoacmeibacter sp. MSK16QG-6]|uniref:diacylglycerol/lipid kinase family protein n=1 Tax=Notoacmeibacter sp. MSK16QG-6 TaxID=2957982 RepID=UPI00209F2527|nr:diacylglycerol kinase family protein [Notoacmeibacter sp. MSK16QG-6]MCP1199741.1 diacylglycerol kinase family lipid kinase [Notoacmeibacter sp. MSK16QG-6]
MKTIAVLNVDGGTLKTTDLDEFSEHLRKSFEKRGHEIEIRRVPGPDIVEALREAAKDCEVMVVGGGDGTVSAAAEIAWRNQRVLGVLPAGTMNLFARSLGLPLDINEAATALAQMNIRPSDIADMDGKAFIHQFSVGLQPRIVAKRSEMDYNSKFGKIVASTRASLSVFFQPTWFRSELTVDGRQIKNGRFSVITVTNNPYGEGHMPYADKLTTGQLGVYWSRPLSPLGSMRLTKDLLLGSWKRNQDFKEEAGDTVKLRFKGKLHHVSASLDGELLEPNDPTVVTIHPGELRTIYCPDDDESNADPEQVSEVSARKDDVPGRPAS